MPPTPPSRPRPGPRPRPTPGPYLRRTRRTRRWGLWTAGLLSGTVLATSGVGWAVVTGLGGSLGRIDAFKGLTNRPADDASQNFLIVGTDDREGVPPATLRALHAGGESCHCTDTMMLVHLSANGDAASVVSIPRDSYVPIPGHGMGKINAAYGMGGAPLTVATVEQATGLRIDHYLQLNFLSFISTVDALGGVPVCTNRPLRDPKSGLDLPAGTTRLDGAEALRYVRARYVDPTADLGRMQRQQKFVAQVIQQATSSGTLLNPVKLERVLSSVLASVKVDQGLSTQDLVTLAGRLKDLRPSSASFATVPLADLNHQVPGWGSTVLWDESRARELFAALKADRPLTPAAPKPTPAVATAGSSGVPAAQVHVQVLNGAGVAGLGAEVDARLRAQGFATTGFARNAPAARRTVIRYDPRWDVSVRTLAAAFPEAELVRAEGQGATMQLVLGADYTSTAAASSPAPTPSPTASLDATRGDQVLCH